MYEELANRLNYSGLTPNPTDRMEKANIELMKVRLGIPEVYINKDLLELLDLPISELTTAQTTAKLSPKDNQMKESNLAQEEAKHELDYEETKTDFYTQQTQFV